MMLDVNVLMLIWNCELSDSVDNFSNPRTMMKLSVDIVTPDVLFAGIRMLWEAYGWL